MTNPDSAELPPEPTSTAAVEELVRANIESNETMVSLVKEVRRDADLTTEKVALLQRGQVQTSRLLLMVGVVLILLLGLGIANAINVANARKNAEVTAGIARSSQSTYRLLLDCLNSQGACGKHNAEQQKKALDEIKRYELTGFYCARTNPLGEDPSGDKFLACMNRLYPGGPALSGR